MEKYLGLGEALLIRRINYEDDRVNFVKVVLPQPCRLATYVPQSEIIVLVLDLLDVQPHSGHCFFILVVSHLEQKRRLAGIVEAQEENLLVLVLISTNCVFQVLFAYVTTHD